MAAPWPPPSGSRRGLQSRVQRLYAGLAHALSQRASFDFGAARLFLSRVHHARLLQLRRKSTSAAPSTACTRASTTATTTSGREVPTLYAEINGSVELERHLRGWSRMSVVWRGSTRALAWPGSPPSTQWDARIRLGCRTGRTEPFAERGWDKRAAQRCAGSLWGVRTGVVLAISRAF